MNDHAEQIRKIMGLRAPTQQIVYIQDGRRVVFDYEKLELMLEDGVNRVFSRIFWRMIPILDILNQVSEICSM